MSGRLRSDLLVSAILRATQASGGFGAVQYRGHEEAGTVYLLIRAGAQLSVFVETTSPGDAFGGALAWRCRLPEGDEAAADALIAKERGFDRDLWVVEVEGITDLGTLPGGASLIGEGA